MKSEDIRLNQFVRVHAEGTTKKDIEGNEVDISAMTLRVMGLSNENKSVLVSNVLDLSEGWTIDVRYLEPVER